MIYNVHDKCTGCYACIDICPKSCITINLKKGYIYPKVNTLECIECGKCIRICPALNIPSYKNINFKQRLYAAYNKNPKIRSISSSGGIFYELAKYILSQQGVVYGATLKSLKCKHIAITWASELPLLIGSKYIQSDLTGIYKNIINRKKHKPILFVGTPCQCSALLNIFGKNRPTNVYIVDFICHGVPSQDIFDKCIRLYESQNNCNIIDFSFRTKTDKALRNYKLTYDKNGKKTEIIGNPADFPFYNAFLNHTIFRKSCFKCNYKTITRVSDITLGDFWGIEKINSHVSINKGCSSIIINNQKGEFLLNNIQIDLLIKEYDIAFIIDNNYALTNKDRVPLKHKLYHLLYNRVSPRTLSELCLTNKPKAIGKIIQTIINKIEQFII